jgi:hypothetical protein
MMSTWQKLGMVVVASGLVAAVGCGGGKKAPVEPEQEVVVDDGDDEEDVIIEEDKFDEISSFFKRKRRLVSRCFVKALEAGEVAKTDKAAVQVTMTISKSGKVKDARISSCSHKSEVLQECVLEYARAWTVTTLPKDLDYSYTFGMGRL